MNNMETFPSGALGFVKVSAVSFREMHSLLLQQL